jgi:hypothetical protein
MTKIIKIKLYIDSSSSSTATADSNTTAVSSAFSSFLRRPVVYKDCENELKLKAANKQQCSFVECYASFNDYKIVKCKSSGLQQQQQQQQTSMPTSFTSASLSQLHAHQQSFGKRKQSIEEFTEHTPPSSAHDEPLKNNDTEKNALIKILCNRQVCLKILALVIEIIDNLLEDWYPDLGTRFMQDSKGDYLVTRLAPCHDCIRHVPSSSQLRRSQSKPSSHSLTATSSSANLFVDTFSISASEDTASQQPPPSIPTTNDDTADELEFSAQDEEKLKQFDGLDWIYCFMLDDICYSVMKSSRLMCPRHGRQTAHVIAPDLAFEDIESNFLIANDSLRLEALLGRGSFGSVFAGLLTFRSGGDSHDAEVIGYAKEDLVVKVAVKVLETLSGVGSAVEAPHNPVSNHQQKLKSVKNEQKSWENLQKSVKNGQKRKLST